MPKSVRRMRPSGSSSTLPGLMSRWTMRARWAAVRASATAMPDLDGEPDRQPPVGVEALAQRLARDELHHDGFDVAVGHGVEHGDDRRVGEAGDGDGLPPEPLDEAGVRRQRRLEHLHRDLAVEHHVGGDPHLGHAADREAALEAVAPGQRARVGRRRRWRRRHAGLTHRERTLLAAGGAVAAVSGHAGRSAGAAAGIPHATPALGWCCAPRDALDAPVAAEVAHPPRRQHEQRADGEHHAEARQRRGVHGQLGRRRHRAGRPRAS